MSTPSLAESDQRGRPAATVAAPGALKPTRRSHLQREEAVAGLVFVLPFILGFMIFTAGPMLASLYLSFTSYDVLNPPVWVGLHNYRQMVGDQLWLKSLGNTFFYAFLHVPLAMLTALGLALLLNTRVRGLSFFRTAFYLPTITPVVAASVLWLRILGSQNGLLNAALGLLHIPGPSWLLDANWVKPALVIFGIWGVGGTMVIYLAALQQVPKEMHEAAVVDGANPFQRFVSITIPMISGVLFFTLVLGSIGALQLFTQAYIIFPVDGSSTHEAGPQNSALFYVPNLFEQAFSYFHMGYASALAWILFIIIMIITLIQVRGSRRFVYTEASRE
ncbi:MAG: carbohydrate ABC transporter permease [Chloroflexota bacterium]